MANALSLSWSFRHATAASLVAVVLSGCASSTPVTPREASAAELMQRGLTLAKHGDDFAAEQYLEAARTAGFTESDVVRELVGVCVRAGRLEQALAHAESYLARNPDDWLLRHVIATIHFAKGDRDSARYELELLLSEHPEHAESHFLLGVLLRDAFFDLGGAKHALERYLTLSPNGTHAREARAFIRRSEGFPQRSVKEQTP